MSEYTGNRVIIVALVALLVVATFTAYGLTTFWQATHPDPHQQTREYSITGVIGDEPCSGSCQIEYVPESHTVYLYSITGHVSSQSGKEVTLKSGVVFQKDDSMDRNRYDYVGTDVIEDQEVDIWEDKENSCRYYVGDTCQILRLEIHTEEYMLIGVLN